jgi:septum formation protein
MHLILASASPRRADLLAAAGFTFEVVPAEVNEDPLPGEAPTVYALRVARDKAACIAVDRRKSGSVVLAADTVVVAGTRLLLKPASREDAESMLKSLSGRVHEVHTAVVLRTDRGEVSEVVTTRVRVLPLSQTEIAAYIASGEPEGKAGAYAIQGRASKYIDWIEGSWSNVVGLPVATVYRLLKQVGELD